MSTSYPYSHASARGSFEPNYTEYLPGTGGEYSSPIVSLAPFDNHMAGSYKDPALQDEIAFSPARTTDEMHNIPRLSTASESGTSVQSTSSSAIPSPNMYPQTDMGWIMRGNSLPENDFRSTEHLYYHQSSHTNEPDTKMMSFISKLSH